MEFEKEVLKLLGELNHRQIGFEKEVYNRFSNMDKRFNKFESELASVKKRADLTHQEVLSIREDMTMSKEKENKMKEEQEYQLNKWVDLDRRVDKLERKILS